jgi:hypothetical protein
MSTEILRRVLPEEEELAKKREELALLQAELADQELSLNNLRVELSVFEGRYLRHVGVLYAELDSWNAKIAELVATDEGTGEAQSSARQARTRAEESYSTVYGEAAKAKDFTPSAELKSLYREVAKRVHPDLATDDADRHKRERLMADANRAYGQGDADALRKILEEQESSPESVQGAGAASDLVRVIRQIKQISNRLTQIQRELGSLIDSDMARLKVKVDAASAQGHDLLAEMALDVKLRIDAARHRFGVLSTETAKP